MTKKRKDDETGPVEAVALHGFVLGPGETAVKGEIITLERNQFNSLRGMKCVAEATDEDVADRKKALAASKKKTAKD
jgi:hypothetical protein